MPTHIQQQTLRYERHEETIAVLARAIDLLGKKDTDKALEVLMGWRNYLQDRQIPTVENYDPRAEQLRAGR